MKAQDELPAIYRDATGKLIPNTDMGKVRYYGTTWNTCTCPDFERIRKDGSTGGNYIDPISKDRCCKHIHWIRAIERSNNRAALVSAQEQEVKAKQAINRLYGQPVTQVIQPTWSLNYLELDAPAAPTRKEPTAEELFARFQ